MIKKTSDLTQLTRQEAKETACNMAISRGYALIRRGDKEMWRIRKGENTRFLCRCEDAHTLWHSAIEMIQHEDSMRRAPVVNPWIKFAANVAHNTIIHPIMPFTWGRVAKAVDILHDVTGRIAFGDDE